MLDAKWERAGIVNQDIDLIVLCQDIFHDLTHLGQVGYIQTVEACDGGLVFKETERLFRTPMIKIAKCQVCPGFVQSNCQCSSDPGTSSRDDSEFALECISNDETLY